ncbi:hypothetical protein HFN89_04120 [Rhizobium laguerreae]|nr:hypothetical protein [Rhizobium laguerreae]
MDDLHPKDAKDLMARVGPGTNSPVENYNDYRRIVAERVKNPRIAALTMKSPDFEERLARAVKFIAGEISRLLIVDGVRYKENAGIAIAVNTEYNRHIEVYEMEMWDGSLWTQKPHNVWRAADHIKTHYFAYADRDGALAFANEIGAALGRKVNVRDDDVTAFVPTDGFPKQNMRWAELVRSATVVAHHTGFEVARRIRNQEGSIFTDDRSLRYAFDSLMEALDDADAFGEPHDRLEVAARDMLDLVKRKTQAFNAKYRNFVERWEPAFNHLEIALSRWDDRPLEIEVSYAQPGMTR